MDELEKCFANKSLIKTTAEPQLAKKSLKRAHSVLKEVPKALSIDLLELAEQRLYQAVFHAVKALLYNDGIKERSHYCVSLYFKEKYQKLTSEELLTLLDRLRDVRHESQYGLEAPELDKSQIESWFQEALVLFKDIQKILENKKGNF